MITLDELAYELWLADTPHDYQPAFDMVRDFLDAHGINVHNSYRVPEDARARVTRNNDGTYQFSCWVNQVDDSGMVVACECGTGIRQERVDLPLASPVPVIPGAHFWSKTCTDLARVLPEDPQAMSEAAQRFYMEQHAHDTSVSVDRLSRRQSSVGDFLANAEAVTA